MNSVNIIGRLVRDPDVKRTNDGMAICNLRIAIDDTFSREDRADFINVTVFGSQAGVCERYLRKGFLAGVSGRIRSEAYTDSEGVKRYPVKLIAERVQILQWPERKESVVTAGMPPSNDTAEAPVMNEANDVTEVAGMNEAIDAVNIPDAADTAYTAYAADTTETAGSTSLF